MGVSNFSKLFYALAILVLLLVLVNKYTHFLLFATILYLVLGSLFMRNYKSFALFNIATTLGAIYAYVMHGNFLYFVLVVIFLISIIGSFIRPNKRSMNRRIVRSKPVMKSRTKRNEPMNQTFVSNSAKTTAQKQKRTTDSLPTEDLSDEFPLSEDFSSEKQFSTHKIIDDLEELPSQSENFSQRMKILEDIVPKEDVREAKIAVKRKVKKAAVKKAAKISAAKKSVARSLKKRAVAKKAKNSKRVRNTKQKKAKRSKFKKSSKRKFKPNKRRK